MTAPYKPGDEIWVLTAHPMHGTAAVTRKVQYIRQAPTSGEWTIVWISLDGAITATRVNEQGRDVHGYVTPAQ